MATLPRLNGIIRALESGQPAFSSFVAPDIGSALAASTSSYDGIIFETEHNHYDIAGLRDAFQYLLNRAQIAASGSLAPGVTPLVRIPPNGGEMNQFLAKQVLDIGAYGVVWPHISNAEQAYNAVGACRYPRPQSSPRFEPVGMRGDGPGRALTYWGLGRQQYYARADVWPLAPEGEIFVMLMIEDVEGLNNIDDILGRVDGIGAVLIGEGDLSQELGHPREYEHPLVLKAMAHIVAACKRHDVVVGHPHVGTHNVERVLDEGYRFLMTAPESVDPALVLGRRLAGR
ncbi:HpcH/HpaI aldolase family protein [Devosia sp.]|uniref:HpcH/HpaI aldolase family protein n=1 Tax=Devosia sp. TaxID=1871048 RepID=UPI002AFFEAB5|nr:aldolase/citrate lyase family protein [Devosia sp.]